MDASSEPPEGQAQEDETPQGKHASNSQNGAERRAQPRAQADWPITIALSEGYFQARLRDVSSSGVCFHMDRAVPEMTVLRMQLELPGTQGSRRVDGTGVVVRCQRVAPAMEHFEVAVFFNELGEEDRAALRAYVSPEAG